MRNHAFSLAIAIAIGLAASPTGQITVPSTAPPQTRAGGNITTKAPAGPVPRKPNGQPDLTGVWLRRASCPSQFFLAPVLLPPIQFPLYFGD